MTVSKLFIVICSRTTFRWYQDGASLLRRTIQPHLLVKKLLDINVPCGLIQWTLDYLTNRSQYVKIGQSSTSNVISSSTGAPQGTVLAPFLFTLYTSGCRSQSSKCPLIKFADDTALIGLISEDDDRAFLSQVDSFVNHCDTNYLEMNVSKTKEMVIDFRQARSDPQPVVLWQELKRINI